MSPKGETEGARQRGTILHGFLRYLEIFGSADFARETLAIVVRLRSSATDADVRPLAVLMGARLLLKIEADLLFMETFVNIFTKFNRELHEVLEVFGP